MEELEVKAMLEDSRIPEQYKRGGRLSSEFLDGVDYAEQRIMEKGVKVWLTRDPDGEVRGFFGEPVFDEEEEIWTDNPGAIGNGPDFFLDEYDFYDITFENSPKKARIILED
jgi:hypothetical protein